MDAHSRDANPSHAHRVTHTRARSRENEPIARTNPHKVSNARARPLSRTPHSPTSAHSGTRRATHTTLSFTRSDPQQHHHSHCLILHTRAPRSHPQSLGPSITPPGSRARGPQALVSPRRSPRHPKAPRVRASLGRQSQLSARRPGGPRALSPRRGRRSSGGARLGAPALAPQPPAARPPRPGRLRGRGGALPARQPLGPLARGGRPPRPMAARGRGPVAGGPGGAGAGRAEGLTGGVAAGGGRARSLAGPVGRGECQDGPARARCPPASPGGRRGTLPLAPVRVLPVGGERATCWRGGDTRESAFTVFLPNPTRSLGSSHRFHGEPAARWGPEPRPRTTCFTFLILWCFSSERIRATGSPTPRLKEKQAGAGPGRSGWVRRSALAAGAGVRILGTDLRTAHQPC